MSEAISPRLEQKLELCRQIHDVPPVEDDLKVYSVRALVMATLPHRDPGELAIWMRQTPWSVLCILPWVDDDGRRRYPWGSIPRLLLYWIVTEAVRKRCRRIDITSNLSEFMRQIGLNPDTGGGKRGDAKRLKDQMDRLLNAQIRFSQKSPTGDILRWINMPVTEIGELWWKTPESPQGCLFQSYIVLSEGFFRLVTDKPFPLDRRALTVLKQSPLALDLYAWTVCRSYGLKKGVPVSWQALKEQLGADYADLANFGREVRETLKKVKSVFPGLNYQCAPGGVVLLPGYPAVPKKKPMDKVIIHGEMVHPAAANDSAAFSKVTTVKRYKRGR